MFHDVLGIHAEFCVFRHKNYSKLLIRAGALTSQRRGMEFIT